MQDHGPLAETVAEFHLARIGVDKRQLRRHALTQLRRNAHLIDKLNIGIERRLRPRDGRRNDDESITQQQTPSYATSDHGCLLPAAVGGFAGPGGVSGSPSVAMIFIA